MKTYSTCLPLALYLLAALPSQSAQTDPEVLRGTTADILGMASTDRLQTPTMFREVHLRIPLPHGGHLKGELLIAHDTASHRFWWSLQNDGEQRLRLDSAQWFASHAATFVAGDKMVVFWAQTPGNLCVIERGGITADTMEEAQQKAVGEIRRRAAASERENAFWLGLGMTVIPLPQSRIPVFFWIDRSVSTFQYPSPTKVISVSKEGTNWKLVLKDQWEQELVLDEKYNFVSSRRLGPPE